MDKPAGLPCAFVHIYHVSPGEAKRRDVPVKKTIALCLVGNLGAAVASADVGNEIHVPATVSPEARRELRALDPSFLETKLPAPDDVEGWTQTQEALEEEGRAQSYALAKRLGVSVAEKSLNGVPVLDLRPKGWKETSQLVVYTHGGAYTLYSAHTTLSGAAPVVADTGRRVISIDYTLAPHAQWQRTTDQVIAVVKALVAQGHPLDQMAIYGDSAGGGLAAGSVLKMRDQGQGMPAAVVLWSPWADITESGDSYFTLKYGGGKDGDPILSYANALANSAAAYADPKDQKHPYVSPVYGDYSKGFPPTLIQGGTKEIFLSNFVRLYQALDQAAVPVKLDLYEGMWHVFQAMAPEIPESRLARRKMKAFLDEVLGAP